AQPVAAAVVAVGVVQGADDDDQASALVAVQKARGHALQVGVLALGPQRLQELQQGQQPPLAAGKREVLEDVAGEGGDGDAVEVGQGDVGQGGGYLAGEVELGRLPEGHAPRAVHQEVDVQVLLLLEALEQQLVQAGEQV